MICKNRDKGWKSKAWLNNIFLKAKSNNTRGTATEQCSCKQKFCFVIYLRYLFWGYISFANYTCLFIPNSHLLQTMDFFHRVSLNESLIQMGYLKTLEKKKSIISEIFTKNHVKNHFGLNDPTFLRITRLNHNFVILIKKQCVQKAKVF